MQKGLQKFSLSFFYIYTKKEKKLSETTEIIVLIPQIILTSIFSLLL